MAQQSGYLPGIAPPATDPELQQALQWSQRELDNISRQFTNFDTVQYNVLHAPPEKPRDGMTVVADGVNWNPGYGPGLYVYSESTGTWKPVGGGDSSFAFKVHNNNVHWGIADSTWTFPPWSTLEYYTPSNWVLDPYTGVGAWKPPAGIVHLDANFYVFPDTGGAMAPGAFYALQILRNGGSILYAINYSTGGAVPIRVSGDDYTNGANYYTTQLFTSGTTGPILVYGAPALSHFSGHWVGPK